MNLFIIIIIVVMAIILDLILVSQEMKVEIRKNFMVYLV